MDKERGGTPPDLEAIVKLEAATHIQDPIELAAFQQTFDLRREVGESIVQSYRTGARNDRWKMGHGWYGRHPINEERDVFSTVDYSLYGEEILLNKYAQGNLNGDSHPALPRVVLDFGGGLGLSMIRVAALNRDLIENGNLLIIVTNVAFLPDAEPDEEGYSGIAKILNDDNKTGDFYTLSPSELAFIQENQDLVQFIPATAEELAEKEVVARNGQTFPLKGNANLVHEDLAITHLQTPDIALLTLGQLVKKDGLFLLNTYSMHSTYPEKITIANGATINTRREDYAWSRDHALDIGKNCLTKHMGLDAVSIWRFGGVKYKRTNAVEVSVS